MGNIPHIDNAIRVAQNEEVLAEWLVLEARGVQYYSKPYKKSRCAIHQREFCYECWRHLAANEVVCVVLADFLGLPSLRYALLRFNGQRYFGIEFLGRHAKLRDYLRGEGPSAKTKISFMNGAEIAGQSLCLDLFVNNTDRTCANYVYQIKSDGARLYSIDYDKALLPSVHKWKGSIEWLKRGWVVEQGCEKLIQFWQSNNAAMRKGFAETLEAIRSLTPQVIESAIEQVPSDWWPSGDCSFALAEALCVRRESFDPHPDCVTVKEPPCIRDQGMRTCQGYTVPDMFVGEQFGDASGG